MVPALAAKVTSTRLRALARLHRDGVHGAGDELVQLAHESPVELADLLGRDADWVVRIRRAEQAAGAFAAAIESRSRDARRSRKDDVRRRAAGMAEQLARRCSLDGNGDVLVDVATLSELARLRSHRWLGFSRDEGKRAIETGLLKAAFVRLKTATIRDLRITGDDLVIEYVTKVGHGRFRLRLHPRADQDDVLVIPLRSTMTCSVRELPSGADQPAQPERSASTTARRPAHRPRNRPGLVAHLLSAFTDAVGR